MNGGSQPTARKARAGELTRYIEAEMKPALEELGFRCRVMRHDKARGPFLSAERVSEVCATHQTCGASDSCWRNNYSSGGMGVAGAGDSRSNPGHVPIPNSLEIHFAAIILKHSGRNLFSCAPF